MDASTDNVCMAVLRALERRHSARRPGNAPRPIPALVLARKFAIRPGGTSDSRKRGVRLVVEQLRRQGHAVLASPAGYHLGADPGDFACYEQFRRRSGLSHLRGAADAMRSEAAADAHGQLSLPFPSSGSASAVHPSSSGLQTARDSRAMRDSAAPKTPLAAQ